MAGKEWVYKFSDSCSFSNEYLDEKGYPASSVLWPTWEAYAKNMERVVALPALLAHSAYWWSLTNRAMSWDGVPFNTGVPQQDAMRARNGKAYADCEARMAQNDHALRALGEKKGLDHIWSVGAYVVENASSIEATETPDAAWRVMGDGLESMFYAMVLNSYAAFEAVANDLWLAAVNTDWTLAAAVLNGVHRRPGQTEVQKRAEKQSRLDKQERTVRLAGLDKYQFNLSDRMGDFLEEQGIVDFKSLDGLRRAYREAFGSQADGIFDQESKLVLTEKTRHLIAHRSGLIDETYRKHVRNWPEFGNDRVGEYLEIDGKQVAELIDAVVKTASALMRCVDMHLAKAKEKRSNDGSTGT